MSDFQFLLDRIQSNSLNINFFVSNSTRLSEIIFKNLTTVDGLTKNLRNIQRQENIAWVLWLKFDENDDFLQLMVSFFDKTDTEKTVQDFLNSGGSTKVSDVLNDIPIRWIRIPGTEEYSISYPAGTHFGIGLAHNIPTIYKKF